MSAKRTAVPEQNRKKYDVESRDYFAAIEEAEKKGDADRLMKLMAQWEQRLRWLTKNTGCYKAPPALVRRDGETNEEYMDRCYAAKKGW